MPREVDFKDLDEDIGVSMDDVESPARFAPLPKATYKFQVVGWTDRLSAAGNKCIRAYCDVLTPPSDPPPEGMQWADRVQTEFTLVDQALWRLEAFVRAIGALEAWDGASFRSRPTIGKQFLADVTQRAYTRQDGSDGIANEMNEFYPSS